ncbi:GspH/FimT family pseudopilin [Photobacterium aquimaris]|uniref:GspH/FimT family pseudopilin n=1 Tax=Photobacterium aquimaris TaxID=512643 RepID=UPI000D173B5E|nr:GspH/FimT family protein [Photobacterium aquimaris]
MTVTELKGLFIAAKSEAVIRNKQVYLHTIGLTDTKTYTNDWCVSQPLNPPPITAPPTTTPFILLMAIASKDETSNGIKTTPQLRSIA